MNYVSIDGENAIIRVKGRYNLACVSCVEQEIQIALSLHHALQITVDFAETEILSAAALHSLIEMREVVGNANFCIKNANEVIRYLLRETGYQDMMEEGSVP